MASSLLAGVSGLRAHQQMLDVVGNNLANINTIGFKSQRIRFSDLLNETKSTATGGVEGQLGGKNPIQVGLGVKTASIDSDLKQGSLEATGNNLDLAIQGEGYFVLGDGVRSLFSRSGAFAVDSSNRLVDPSTGLRVIRNGTVGEGTDSTPPFQIPGDPTIQVPFGTSIPGQATSSIVMQGNLSASAVGPLAETLTSNQPFRVGGSPAVTTSALNSLDTNLVDYVDGDTILLGGTDADGTVISATFTFGAANDGTTLADLIAVINSAYSQAAASLDAQGNLVLKADDTGPAKLNLTIADSPTNVGATSFSNHTMLLTVDGKVGDTVKTSIQIFDSQGTPHNLTLTLQKQAANLWDLTAAIDANIGVILDGRIDGLQFNDDGSFRQASGTGEGDADISLQFNGLSNPQTITFDLGTTNGFNGLTNYGGTTSAAANDQNGFTAGFLTGVSVAPDGTIAGVFTNGRTLSIAQLAIASFSNPGGLEREGDNYFGLSNNSGLPLIGNALSGGRGTVQSGTLEGSNVEVALEFTRLITAQRGFQANARTITATDEILQELSNIVR